MAQRCRGGKKGTYERQRSPQNRTYSLRGGIQVYLHSSFASALVGSGWSMPCPGCVTPRKETSFPLYRRLRRSPGQVWMGAEKSWPHWDLIPGPHSPQVTISGEGEQYKGCKGIAPLDVYAQH